MLVKREGGYKDKKKGEPSFASPRYNAGIEPFSRFAWPFQETNID